MQRGFKLVFALIIVIGGLLVQRDLSPVVLAADTQAPTAPTGLTASAVSGTQINLSWAPSVDNLAVTGYDVYRYGTKIASTTTTSYSNMNLTASTAYSYAVKAKDGAGNVSAFSKTIGATTTPVPISSASKKGVGSSKYLAGGLPQADFDKLLNLDVEWTYNWSIDYTGTNNTSIEYVPQIWGPGAVTPATLNTLAQGKASGKFKHLLAFNEPDIYEQSWMTVQSAIDLWPTLMTTGLRLGSPAVALSAETYAYGQTWLEGFMNEAAVRGFHVDFIAVHYYPDFMNPNAAENLRVSLTNLYNQYQKPIWITELGAINVGQLSSTPTVQGAQQFMTNAIPMLESLSFVERYAWFDDNCSNDPGCAYTTLYNASDSLTALGGTYRSLSMTPLFRFGWTATSNVSSGDVPANMFDNHLSTRWSTGQAQAAGQYFTVDMTGARTFSRIVMDANGSGDYARGYQVFISNDGVTWGNAIAAGAGAGSVITIDFPQVIARYIKVVQTGSAPANYWSVHEFNVYN
jgi:hypothetical protein